jgi:hypothetical protein
VYNVFAFASVILPSDHSKNDGEPAPWGMGNPALNTNDIDVECALYSGLLQFPVGPAALITNLRLRIKILEEKN